ncbi:MAG: CoA pyrophosphatase [Candidatus Bathyarchaeia archaeon]
MNVSFDMQGLRRRLLSVNADPGLMDAYPPDAAVAVIIDQSERPGSILLIRRTEREGDRWSGQIAFPGGHRESSDRTFLDTAIREAEEEVGISLREHEILGALPLVHSQRRSVRVAPFVFQLKTRVEIQPNREVADAFWLALSDIANNVITKTKVQVENGNLVTDSYIYRGYVIWGLTFRIINLLLDKIVDAQSTH